MSAPVLTKYGPMIYEDELPADMPQADYDAWYAESRVIDGVRMGPPYPDEVADG